MKLMDAIKERKSVMKFHHKKPDWKKIIRALDAVRFAPSAGNNFVTRFILVKDEKKLKELAAATQQSFVGDASYIVVAVTDDSKLIQDYGEKGERYGAQQTGAAIENFLLALTEQKLATTWIGHFYDEQVRRTLGIPEGLKIEALFPIGLELEKKAKSMNKMELDRVLYYDKWMNKKMVPMLKFSRDAT
jgi:nitroreductase